MRTELDRYPPGTERIKLILECGDGQEFGFDMHYLVEKKTNGAWSQVPFKTSATFRSVMRYAVPKSGTSQAKTETTIDIRDLQESLSAGSYRVSKMIGDQTVYAEFSVTQ